MGMGGRLRIPRWPVLVQLTGPDKTGRGQAAQSPRSRRLEPRTATADRRPFGTGWERLDLDAAMDMIADRVIETRRDTWEAEHGGKVTRRTMGIAHLGGATLDNEENYLIKKPVDRAWHRPGRESGPRVPFLDRRRARHLFRTSPRRTRSASSG